MRREKRMNKLFHKSSGGISVSAMLIVVIVALSGGYMQTIRLIAVLRKK